MVFLLNLPVKSPRSWVRLLLALAMTACALADALLLAPELVEQPGDARPRVLIDRASPNDLGGASHLAEGLLPGLELVRREAAGRVAEPVRLSIQGGHVGDRMLGAAASRAFGGEGEVAAGQQRQGQRGGEQGRPPSRLALGGDGGPRRGGRDLGGAG